MATGIVGLSLPALAERTQQSSAPVAMDAAALAKAMLALKTNNGATLPKATPGLAGASPALTAQSLDAAVKLALPAISAQEKARVSAGEAATAKLGLLPEYEMPGGSARRVVGVSASGIPLYAKEMSLDSNTFDTTNFIWDTYGISGTGRKVGVWDIGTPLTTHLDFIDPVTGLSRVFSSGPLSVASHATAVCGIVGGLGSFANGADTTSGGSYNAPIEARSIVNEFANMNGLTLDAMRFHNHSYAFGAGWGQQALVSGLTYVVRAWYGDIRVSLAESALFGRYNDISSQTDAVVRNRPWTLPVWSAGNDKGELPNGNLVTVVQNGINKGSNYFFTFRSPLAGQAVVAGLFNGTTFWPLAGSVFTLNLPAVATVPITAVPITMVGNPGNDGSTGFDCVPDGYGVAKNILTVGAINATGSPAVLANFSATGPVDDGRIKPDIVTSGVNVFAPTSVSTSGTALWTGTSMAAPQAVGALNLMAEQQENLWTVKHPLVASTYKALAIHTAIDYGNPGPDYTYGWGQLAAFDATALIESNFNIQQRIFIKEVNLDATTDSVFIIKATGGAPIKITAAWTDPTPAAVQPDTLDPANRMIVNNVDVELYRLNADGSQGTRYHAWRLNPGVPAANATRTLLDQNLETKDRNNVEQILMPVSASANVLYQVVVKKKTQAPFGAFVGDADGKQRVSLVLSGVKERPEYLFQVTAQTFAIVPGSVVALLTWRSIPGENYRIEFSTTLQAGSWVDACNGKQFLANADSTTASTVSLANLGSSGFFRITTIAPNPFNAP